ncbi:hypothetical protein ACFQ0G_37830 [Streptomyces chiangmaiensis]
MDESGGSGQPRPGNDGANDREAAPTARTAEPAHPEPERDRAHRPAPRTEPAASRDEAAAPASGGQGEEPVAADAENGDSGPTGAAGPSRQEPDGPP